MDELRENEQYFFDSQTVAHLANFVRVYPNPCCLCARAWARNSNALALRLEL